MATKEHPTAWARPRAYRNFTIGFGLVNIDICIGTLFEDPSLGGKYLCPTHLKPVKERFYCEEGDHIVDAGPDVEEGRYRPVTGYEFGDHYVVPPAGDLQAIKHVGEKEMEIERIVPVASIDPAYYSQAYKVWPGKGTRNEAAFGILATAMRTDARAAVGRIALNSNQHLVVLRWSDHFGIMICHICRFEEDVKWGDVNLIKGGADQMTAPTKAELSAARPLIASLDGDFDPSIMVDGNRSRMRALIAALGKGKKAPKVKAKTKTVTNGDLMDALRASVKDAAEQREKELV